MCVMYFHFYIIHTHFAPPLKQNQWTHFTVDHHIKMSQRM